MKILLFIPTLVALFLLQACAGQATTAEWDSYDQWKRSSKPTTAGNKANRQANHDAPRSQSANDIRLTTPETQLIRELYDAGCIIEDFTLDRRKQNIQISCAKGHVEGDSRI